jgi:hypothetical protein
MERRHGVAGGRVLVNLLMIGAVVSDIPTPARAASIDRVGLYAGTDSLSSTSHRGGLHHRYRYRRGNHWR